MTTISEDEARSHSLLRTISDDMSIEMEHSITASRVSSRQTQRSTSIPNATIGGVARHTLGLCLLLCVVFAWTTSNFLGSSIFADNTYAKPFFLTYLNTSSFMLAMVPTFIRSGYQQRQDGNLYSIFRRLMPRRRDIKSIHSEDQDESEAFLKPDDHDRSTKSSPKRQRIHLGLKPTARLSFTFCMLWFCANYFAMACLQHTTVASTTILTSTSSIWTLLFGSLTRTEKFTWRKLCGVLGSLIGIMIISRIDLSEAPDNSGKRHLSHPYLYPRAPSTFPDKRPAELALGDGLALLSAVIYGVYTIALKRATLIAAPLQLNMPLFFGLVGLFNTILLWPLFPLLSLTRLEPFGLPPNPRIWKILLINSATSLFSDICWAYAMVLTSPLVVTVGLSLTIPLSLVGEMIIQGRTEGLAYWVGAAIVVFSFVFVDREEVKEEGGGAVTVPTVIIESPSPRSSARSSRAEVLTSEELPR